MTKGFGKMKQKSWRNILNYHAAEDQPVTNEMPIVKEVEEETFENEKLEMILEDSLINFDKEEEKEIQEYSQEPVVMPVIETPSTISSSVVICGDIQSKGPLELHGEVNGNVLSDDVVTCDGQIIGGVKARSLTLLGAMVQGDIICEDCIQLLRQCEVVGNIQGKEITINGRLKGDITCLGTLCLLEGSFIEGNISTSTLKVSEGAQVSGCITMNS